jgi:hypothetical protein
LPDGKRILAIRATGDGTAVLVVFVLNWEHAGKRQLPPTTLKAK